MKKLILIGHLVIALFFSGCGGATGGSEAGNPDKISVRVIGYQSSLLQGLMLQSLVVNGITVDTAQVVLNRIRFRPFSVCEDEEEEGDDIRFEGPFVVDLLQPGPLSGLEDIEVPPDTYCRIELRLEKLESNVNGNGSILGRSVLIEGTRTDGKPFRVTLEVDEEFELENETSGFQVDALDGFDQFFIAFDLDQWFLGLNLDDPAIEISLDGNGDPIILIDDDHNTGIRDFVIDNIERSADLFEDEDDDNELDADEQEDSLAEGKTVL